MTVMVTYDLHYADEEMHKRARLLLENDGWKFSMPVDGGGQVFLPQTTAVGETLLAPTTLRDRVWAMLAAARLNPKRVAVSQNGSVAATAAA